MVYEQVFGRGFKNQPFKIAISGLSDRPVSGVGHCQRFTFWLTLKKLSIRPLGIFLFVYFVFST